MQPSGRGSTARCVMVSTEQRALQQVIELVLTDIIYYVHDINSAGSSAVMDHQL